jgi:hypothetical protein
VFRLDLVRNLEQYAVPVPAFALRAVCRPGGIAGSDIEGLGVLGFNAQPGFDFF